MRSPETHGHARKLLNRYVSGDSDPSPVVFVDHLINCAKRFDFELDHRVFNYLLNAYIRANRIENAIDCFNAMICQDVIPWVPYMNILLTALVRRNMIGELRDLYNKMVLRGIYGDHFTVHVMVRACLKEGRVEEAEEY